MTEVTSWDYHVAMTSRKPPFLTVVFKIVLFCSLSVVCGFLRTFRTLRPIFVRKMSASRFYRSDNVGQPQLAVPTRMRIPSTIVGADRCLQQYPNKSWRISELTPHLQRTIIIGLVIVKNSPRFISNKQGSDRYVMNFTLRDSQRDTINATCWGSEEFVLGLSGHFAIGDIVEVRNADIRLISASDNTQYKPKASSPFNLTVNEPYSSVCLCTSSESSRLKVLVGTPLWSPCSITSLAEVQRFDPNDNLREQRVHLLVSIKKVGLPREFVSSKTGQPFVKCDVIVFDQSHNYFVIQLWDAEWIQYAKRWTPKDCVVLAQDVKLTYDEYRRAIVGTSDGRTIFTDNPGSACKDMREALMLYTYMQSVVMSEDDSEDCIDLEEIQDVYTVEGIKRRVDAETEANKGPFRGILYASFTRLDLDGDSFVTSVRCSSCKRTLNATVVPCQCKNLECSAGAGHEVTNPFQQLDMSVALTDHTGTLERGRLNGNVADALLGCTVDEFLKLNSAERTMLKWQFLLEKAKCYFQVSVHSSGQGGLSVKLLYIAKAEVPEVCSKIPNAIE